MQPPSEPVEPVEQQRVPVDDKPPLLEIRGLSKRFGGVRANDSISFDVAEGDLVAVIGPNGSGKTTLLNAISGQAPPDAGSVRFNGHELAGRTPAAIARLGLVRTFQQAGVYDALTALENVRASVDRSGERLHHLWRRDEPAILTEAMHCLDFVGLADRCGQVAGELSYGQRKLLEFAMALMSRPKMLLLDEPTAGVSPVMVPALVATLQRVNAELGITVLFIEHNMSVVATLARRVHCLTQGRLLSSGSPDQVRADPRVLEAYLGGA
ncbi:MAG: ABC transporter ATP-binding protein [Rubrivivax sp.]|nr:ABC transporter ATP-binding protein [Rubrivivax sp.]